MSESPGKYADTSDMPVVHAMFRREFALLPGLVRGTGAGDGQRAQVIADHIRLISLVLHEHHCAEDTVLWPRLISRAPDEIRPVVALVHGQHDGIDALTGGSTALLDRWAGTAGADDRDELASVLERLVGALYEHMALEEKLVLPVVEKHILASEYEAMVTDGVAKIPPDVGPVLAGMLMYEGGAAALPPGMPDVLAEMAPRAYAAHAQQLHGTAAVPRSTDVVLGSAPIAIRPALRAPAVSWPRSAPLSAAVPASARR